MKSIRIRSFSGAYFPSFGLNTESISVFRPNEGKYGPEKLQIRTHFTQFEIIEIFLFYDQPWAGESMGFDFMFDPKLTRSPLRRLFGKWGLNFWKPFDPSVET